METQKKKAEKLVLFEVRPLKISGKIKVEKIKKIFYDRMFYQLLLKIGLLGIKKGSLVPVLVVFTMIVFILSPILFINQTEVYAVTANTSKCVWWNQELVGTGYQWVLKTDYSVTQEWCEDKSRPPYRSSVFTPAPTPTPTPSPIPTPTPTQEPTPTPTPTQEPTPTPTQEPTPTPTPTQDPTPTPTQDPTPTPTPTQEPTPTPTPTQDPTPTPTPTQDPTPTPTPTQEPTPTPTPTSTPTPTPTPTPVPSSSGGGGSVVVQGLSITNEVKTEVKERSVTITWTTSHFATSRVIYDIVSGKFDADGPLPSYGMAYYKEGDDSGLEKVTGHSVTLTDIVPGTVYYYRTVSVGSLIISQEKSFTAPEFVPVVASVPTPAPTLPPIAPPPAYIPGLAKEPAATPAPAGQYVDPWANLSLNTQTSVVDYLYSTGQAYSFEHMTDLAKENGIPDYTGTAEQNVQLLAVLKKSAVKETPKEEVPAVQDQEAIVTPEAGITDEPANVSGEASNNPTDNKKELQAGAASVAETNSGLGGILKKINILALSILILIAAAALAGKGFWVRMLKKVRS